MVASCWLFLLIHTTMHGSMNTKFTLLNDICNEYECNIFQFLRSYTTRYSACIFLRLKGKGKAHPCTGIEGLYRPIGGVEV